MSKSLCFSWSLSLNEDPLEDLRAPKEARCSPTASSAMLRPVQPIAEMNLGDDI